MASKKWKEENQERLRKYRRDWYARNKRRGIVKSSTRRKELKIWFRELKKGYACKLCGESHPACLQFHHRDLDDKEIEVALAIQNGWGRARIISEIKKCDVLCANCHAKLHWAELYE